MYLLVSSIPSINWFASKFVPTSVAFALCACPRRSEKFAIYLPPAYVVRREGNSFTLFVCPHGGGLGQVPPQGVYPGQVPPQGGYPGQVPPLGGTQVWVPPRGVPRSRYPPGGGTQVRVPPQGGYPGQVPPGGVRVRYPPWGGTRVRYPSPGGVPRFRYPPGGVRVPPPLGGYLGQVPPRGGYPGRTTEGVLTTWRAVCLLRSRRRTFLSCMLLPSCLSEDSLFLAAAVLVQSENLSLSLFLMLSQL